MIKQELNKQPKHKQKSKHKPMHRYDSGSKPGGERPDVIFKNLPALRKPDRYQSQTSCYDESASLQVPSVKFDKVTPEYDPQPSPLSLTFDIRNQQHHYSKVDPNTQETILAQMSQNGKEKLREGAPVPIAAHRFSVGDANRMPSSAEINQGDYTLGILKQIEYNQKQS